jgi:heptaprenyl diphosphate synthase
VAAGSSADVHEKLGDVNANAIAGVELADPGLAAATAAGLSRVEDLLHREVRSDYEFVTETSLHLIDAGGKRFRPLFTLLAAQIGPRPEDDAVYTAAAVVEMIHLATLYHDDVMDSATMRRGAESANSRWDNTVAILTGDFLFAHASRLVADLGPEAVRIIAETFAELVTGQMRETRGPRPGEDPVQHYLAVIAEKTASLIATSGRYGGMFSGCTPEQVEALRRFGATIGTAFQISDDVIDIASASDSSGKTPGTDLREGVLTLPMLYALQESGPEAERLGVLLARPITDDAEVDEALELLRTGRGLARAREVLADQAAAARAELGKLPACPATEALASLTAYVVDRTG